MNFCLSWKIGQLKICKAHKISFFGLVFRHWYVRLFPKNHNSRYALINKPDLYPLLVAHQGWWEKNVYGNCHSLIGSFAGAAMFAELQCSLMELVSVNSCYSYLFTTWCFFSVSMKQRPLRKKNLWKKYESTFLNCDLLTRKSRHQLQQSLRQCMRHWHHKKALWQRNFMNHQQRVPLHLGP